LPNRWPRPTVSISFGQIEGIRYIFNAELPGVELSRRWEWSPKTDTVSYEGKDKDGKPVKVTYQRSQLSSQSDAIKNEIDPAFTNDQYWLLFPLHVAWDSSATVTDEGMYKLPLGNASAERVVVKYPSEGGDSPGDTWELYVGADKRAEEFIYHRGGTKKPSVVIATWADYKKAGPLLISTDHHWTADEKPLRISFSDVLVKVTGSENWIKAQLTREAARKGRPSSVSICGNSGSRHAINPDQFVAVGIAKVGEVHLAGGSLAHARRVFDRRAAIRDAGFVPCLGLFGIAHREADRAAIGMVGRLGVDRLGHHETPAIVRITQPAPGVLDPGLGAHRDKQGIVEFLRPGDVVTPDHDMAEHSVFSS
jgi:hypothetical protein